MISSISGSSYDATAIQRNRRSMFSKIDSNGDGTVEKSEFMEFGAKAPQKAGKAMNSEELFAKIDADRDGKITKDEDEKFLSQMRSLGRMKGPGGGRGDGTVSKEESDEFESKKMSKGGGVGGPPPGGGPGGAPPAGGGRTGSSVGGSEDKNFNGIPDDQETEDANGNGIDDSLEKKSAVYQMLEAFENARSAYSQYSGGAKGISYNAALSLIA